MADVPKEIIDVLIAEALGEGPTGIAAVAHVINRRAQLRGETPVEVVTDDGQFSGYKNPGSSVRRSMNDPQVRKEVESIWQGVVSGEVANPYPRADFFHTPSVNPDWANSYERVGQTGNHIFYVSDQSANAPVSQTAPKPAERINRTLTGGQDAYAASQEIRLAPFRYEYSGGTKRNLPVNEALEKQLVDSVTAVYGPDYTVGVMSGGQGEGSAGQTGTRRHGTGVAGDIWVYDPAGNRLSGDDLVPLAQHWLGNDIGSVGFPNNGNSLHLDLIGGKVDGGVPLGSKEGRLWFYGVPNENQRSLLNASLTDGALPKYAFDPAQVARGLIPPGDIPNVVGSMLDVAPKPAIRSGLLGSLKIDGAGPGATAAELAAFRGPARPRPLSERPRGDGQLVGQERGPARSLVDEIGPGTTREEMNAFRGVDKAYPTELTRRPRPDSYAGLERGTPIVRRSDPVRSISDLAAIYEGGGPTRPGSTPVRSIAEMAALYENGGPTRSGQRQIPSMSTSPISYAGQEGAPTSLLATMHQAPAADRRANFTRAADLDNSTINGFTPVTTRDGQKVISVADMLFGDEMTTELPGGTRRRIPSGGLVGEQSEPMPAATAARSGSNRPASLLAALSGDGMAWNAAQDGPTRRVGSILRQQTASVPTNGSYAGQERGEVVRRPNQGNITPSNTPGIFRVAGLNGTAGNVGLPSGVRPDVDIPDFEADWSEPAPTVQRRNEIGAGTNWDEFTGTFGTRQRQELERKPNPFAYVEPPNALANPTQLSQEPSGQTPRFRTVTREQRYENPEYRTWQANQTGQTNAVPLGEVQNFGARDTAVERERRRQEGLNFVATQMPQQWLTRNVEVQVPIEPAATVVKPVVGAAPPVTRPRAQPVAQNIWQNPIQGLLGAIAPQGGPVAGLLGALMPDRRPSDYWLTATGVLDDGISENHRTPSIGAGK